MVQRVFDLKGSTVDRKTKLTRNTSSLKTLKDENFIALNRASKSGDLVIMFESDRAFIERQLSLDTKFLRDLNIMDYSLLLCIEQRSSIDIEGQRATSSKKSSEKLLPKARCALLPVNHSVKSGGIDDQSSQGSSVGGFSPRNQIT